MPHQCTECGRTFPDGSKEMLSGCPECGGNKFQFDPSSGGGNAGSSGTGSSSGNAGPGGTAGSSGNAGRSGTDESRPDATRDDADPSPPPSTGTDATDSTGKEWPTYGDEPDSIIGSRHADETRRRAATDDADPADEADPQGEAGPASGTDPDDGIIEADESPSEDSAQAAARSGFAGPFEVENGGDDAADADDPEAAEASSPDDTPVDPGEGTVVDEPDGADEDRPDLSELREELNEQFESIRIKSPGQYELNLMELYDREEYIISLKEDGRYVIEVPETWRGSEDD